MSSTARIPMQAQPDIQIVIKRFYTKYVNEYVTDETLTPMGEFVRRARRTGKTVGEDHIIYSPLHSERTEIDARISDLRCVGDMHDAQRNPAINIAYARWEMIRPYYEDWKSGHEPTAHGTPLGAWPGIGPEQAETLRMRGVTVVEQLAKLNDHQFERWGIPNLRFLTDNAKRFLAAASIVDVQDQLAQKDAEIDDLREKMQEMMGMINALRNGPVEARADIFDEPGFVDPRDGEPIMKFPDVPPIDDPDADDGDPASGDGGLLEQSGNEPAYDPPPSPAPRIRKPVSRRK